MNEQLHKIQELSGKLEDLRGLLDVPQKQQKILELEDAMGQPGFWGDNERATGVAKEVAELKEDIEKLESMEQGLEDVAAVLRMEEEHDKSLLQDIEKQVSDLAKQVEALEFVVLLSGEHDEADVIMALHAGAGGVDAMDWTGMLQRMYLRYFESKGWKAEIVDESRGQEAGVKSAVIRVHGRHAYGYLKAEAGVHRLVRISPFDGEKMRHTSFALVEVLPELDDIGEIELRDEDIRIDTFMAGGHGGQSVNTTYSAVRVVHEPTGITVKCQNERSQTQNKETALKILKSKLHQYEQAKLEEEKQALRGEFSEAAWGNQARSYVLHPYKMAKDHRTEHETQDVEKVLDGDLDDFIEAYLKSLKAS